jgi:cellobiose-specific phosphotransferase system component IIB
VETAKNRDIFAVSTSEADQKIESDNIDVLLLGPQVRFKKDFFLHFLYQHTCTHSRCTYQHDCFFCHKKFLLIKRKTIMLVCAAGMSTSMLVQKMQKEAEKQKLDRDICHFQFFDLLLKWKRQKYLYQAFAFQLLFAFFVPKNAKRS